jgi:hypothetical protein
MLDPGSYRQRMPQRHNWTFLLIIGSIILTTVFLAIVAVGFHWL